MFLLRGLDPSLVETKSLGPLTKDLKSSNWAEQVLFVVLPQDPGETLKRELPQQGIQ